MAPAHHRRKLIRQLARARGLILLGPGDLCLHRLRHGRGFRFVDEDGVTLRDKDTLTRLKALAVPPAYEKVRFAAEARGHLQAVGEDAAGRRQYRYHPQWQEVREAAKTERLADLARALPEIQRAVRRRLARRDESLDYASAVVIHLVAATALRAGSESYARERGTRGATTLLKSNIQIEGRTLSLRFRAKGSKLVARAVDDRRLVTAIQQLFALPGRRLFQHRKEDGIVRSVRAGDVNTFLRQISGRQISLKDFRTMVASVGVLGTLATAKPAASERLRRSQVRSAVAVAAEELTNTSAVCRTSYVHDSVVVAFERGTLPRLIKQDSSPAERVAALAKILTRHG